MPPFFPTLNSFLNLLSFALLFLGYAAIRGGRRQTHQRLMLAALASSTAFLACYLYYHSFVQDHLTSKYPYQDWTRAVYLLILVPHVILATLMVPFIIAVVVLAARQHFTWHRRLARWVWPVWIYVSVTGVLVYLMLYVQPLLRGPP